VSVTEECILGPPVVLVYAYEGDATQASSVACWIEGTADYVNTYEYDTEGRLVQIVQAGQSGGNAVAEKEIDFAYNEDGQFATMTRAGATDERCTVRHVLMW